MYKNHSNKAQENFHLFTAFVKYLQFPCANSLLVNLLKGKLCWEDLTRLIQKVPSGNLLSWRPKSFEPRKLLIDISRRQPGPPGKS